MQTINVSVIDRVNNIRRRVAQKIRNRLHPPESWVLAEDNPPRPRPLDDVRLFAIIGAWMEADVIAATVRNAFAQGCERVYLVDNDSPDATVETAVAAGAILAETFKSIQYDEYQRLDIMNAVVQRVSIAEGCKHLWWLWLDADEFPHAPRGLTLLQFLSRLDRKFRIVGARFINHFPSTEPGYESGYHPLDFQPLCEEHRFGCALGHRKHPLQRFDRAGETIVCGRGFHTASSNELPLMEPTEAIYLHHFPYREYSATRQRLTALCANQSNGESRVKQGDDAGDGMLPRFESLEAVYRGDWTRARNYRPETGFSVPNPIPWTSLAPVEDLVVKRWYPVADGHTTRMSP
jgi:glycosyltransferase involved in cell wall biosynthesis